MEENPIAWEILLKRVRGSLSVEEECAFQQWQSKDVRRKEYYERMCRIWSSEEATCDLDTDVAKMMAHFDGCVRNDRRVRRRETMRHVCRAAACLLVLLTVGRGVMWLRREKQDADTGGRTAQVVLPGKENAIILLASGEEVDIDLLPDSSLCRMEGFVVEKDSGVIKCTGGQQAGMVYHTIAIPRGGEYQVVLGDGTKVWLNAETQLKIPTSFTGNERRVFLSGEAYFDVVKNDGQPFIVETELGNIKVYGTEFNVKYYADEGQLKATLVEGAVGFSRTCLPEVQLKPGHRLSLAEGEATPRIEPVKVYNEIAWKNKWFCFENQTLETIARDMERWYNVKFVFEDSCVKQLEFSGTLSRHNEIATVLRFFEESTGIRFLMNGCVITVKAK